MGQDNLNNIDLSGIQGRVRCEPGWSLEAGWATTLQEYDLWLVWSGRGIMRLVDGEIALHPGRCIWMRPGHTYEASQDANDRLGVSFAHFTLDGSADWRPPFEVTDVRSLEMAQATMAEVVRLGTSAPELAAKLLGGLLAVLTHDHAEMRVRMQAPGGATRARHDRAMAAVAARIVEEPGRRWSIRGLARETGLAVDHFSRVFRDALGERPQAYILRHRMARAQQLLRETHWSVSEIAQALGFRDTFYFSRQFRMYYGLPPTHYRRSLLDIRLGSDESST